MAMTLEEARKAITSRLITFTGLAQDRIHLPNNADFVVPEKGLWCRVTINYGPSFITGLGDGLCYRDVGQIAIQCFGRKNTGEKALTQLADYWRDHLRELAVSHLEIPLVHAPRRSEDNDFVQYLVLADFRVN
ncbi:hypothetical protein HCY58_10920 [Acinetobacter radioresistens]|uniref:hypothetical protein n=1 Tax=Acinetobacter radioresistens TaxID=40216 RepID=UPI002005B335|nr:hypothetical protein [Acinetobacter radioresistens]MCK4087560.1 hypothetical protein [Acinetobacter radioresistens]